MSNIERLIQNEGNQRLFANTILDFKNSQGFYSRLYRDINEMPEETFQELCRVLNAQKFECSLDVVLWLEA